MFPYLAMKLPDMGTGGRLIQYLVEDGRHGPQRVPQRLKPHSKRLSYGTAEAVPLNKTGVSATSQFSRGLPLLFR
jgi:hypothetical protein